LGLRYFRYTFTFYNSHWLYAGLSCTICQFWIFGQCKSISDHQRLLYIFGSKAAICMGDELD